MVIPQLNINEIVEILKPLVLFVVSMSGYAIFIFRF